eukprot:1361928-Pyramimonas_sp.AAC.1
MLLVCSLAPSQDQLKEKSRTINTRGRYKNNDPTRDERGMFTTNYCRRTTARRPFSRLGNPLLVWWHTGASPLSQRLATEIRAVRPTCSVAIVAVFIVTRRVETQTGLKNIVSTSKWHKPATELRLYVRPIVTTVIRLKVIQLHFPSRQRMNGERL